MVLMVYSDAHITAMIHFPLLSCFWLYYLFFVTVMLKYATHNEVRYTKYKLIVPSCFQFAACL